MLVAARQITHAREHRLMVYAETGAGRRELEEVWGGEEEGGSGEGRRRCWPRSLPDLAKKSSRLAARPVAPWLSSNIGSRRNDPGRWEPMSERKQGAGTRKASRCSLVARSGIRDQVS